MHLLQKDQTKDQKLTNQSIVVTTEENEENFDITKKVLSDSQYEMYISWRKKKANTLIFNYPIFIGEHELVVKMSNDVMFKFH